MLADVDVDVGGGGEGEDDLEHTGIDSFGAGSGEAGFGDDVGLDVFQGQRDGMIAVAFDVGDGFLVFVDADGLFIFITFAILFNCFSCFFN